MKFRMSLLQSFMVSLVVVSQVQSSGIFELRLHKFTNEFGLNFDGSCCNGERIPFNSRCRSLCRTFFRVCLKQYEARISSDSKCTFGTYTTQLLGGNNVVFNDDFQSVIQLPFSFSWPGTFTLIIEAWHQVTATEPMTKGSSKTLIMRVGKQSSVEIGQPWFHATDTQDSKELQYSYRVICSESYYGAGCSKHCQARSDNFGHYKCDADGNRICNPGWQGEYCEKAICLPGCDAEHGTCKTPNECKCRRGWKGKYCNQCITYPGCQHGTCKRPWQCNCKDGYGGFLCNIDLNYCTRNQPCRNGGTCFNQGQKGYICKCPIGYKGVNCAIKVDKCEDRPCKNGATCLPLASGVQCQCPAGFFGERCELDTPPSCSSQPCRNGATCQDTVNGYKCLCPAGFKGKVCDRQVNECDPNPCINGGTCIDGLNGFECLCRPGWYGQRCGQKYDSCKNQPCENGGSCRDIDNGFECRCPNGFTGKTCSVNIDDCLIDRCQNGGTCHDLVNDFACTCPLGFAGKDCSIKVDFCETGPCVNGATCRNTPGSYACSCPNGFFGQNCEMEFGPESNGLVQQHEAGITMTELLVIVCCALGAPLLAVIAIIVKLMCRKNHARKEKCVRIEEDQNAKNLRVINNRDSRVLKLSDIKLKVVNETQGQKLYTQVDKPSNVDKSAGYKVKCIEDDYIACTQQDNVNECTEQGLSKMVEKRDNGDGCRITNLPDIFSVEVRAPQLNQMSAPPTDSLYATEV